MRYELIVEPRAERDGQQAYWSYEDKQPGLGDQFLLCVDAALERARRTPKLYPLVHRDLRRVLVRRFPFAGFFIVVSKKVHILSLLPCAVDPEMWQSLR